MFYSWILNSMRSPLEGGTDYLKEKYNNILKVYSQDYPLLKT